MSQQHKHRPKLKLLKTRPVRAPSSIQALIDKARVLRNAEELTSLASEAFLQAVGEWDLTDDEFLWAMTVTDKNSTPDEFRAAVTLLTWHPAPHLETP
jgi:hypothetical protein